MSAHMCVCGTGKRARERESERERDKQGNSWESVIQQRCPRQREHVLGHMLVSLLHTDTQNDD